MTGPGQPPRDLPQDPTLSYIPASFRAGEETRTIHPVEAGESSPVSLSEWTVSTRPGLRTGEDADSAADLPTQGYVLTDLIGQGGMGEVWAALQVSLGRTVAVKRLRRDTLASMTDTERRMEVSEFRKEAIISAQLEHPNIVPVHDIGVDPEGQPLLAMKRVQGQPWNLHVREDFRSLPVEDFLTKHLPIMIQMGQAVAFAHSKGIVHRDLKPAQVMTGEFGEVLLMDWGLAVYVGEELVVSSRTSDEGRGSLKMPQDIPTKETATNPSGTPALMAPEQTEVSAANIGPWTDVYLLGGTLYLLLTGSYPHAADTAEKAFAKASLGTIEDPRKRNPDRFVPDELAEICLKALAKEPKDRVPSASEFVRLLQDYLTGANRRRESAALVAEAGEQLASAGGGYQAVGAAIAKINRALNLWPNNETAHAKLAEANHQFAEAAIQNGDLRLARIYAEQVTNDDQRKALDREIDQAEARARAHAMQRRIAFAAAAVLAIALVASGFIYAQGQREARERIERQRDLGEDVMAFMMENLSEELRNVGRLSLMEEVAEKSLEYYSQLSGDDIPVEGLRRRALAFRQVGDVLSDQGRLDDAIESYTRAEQILNDAIAQGEQVELLRNEIALTRIQLGEIRFQESKPDEALRIYREARDIAESLDIDEAKLTLASAYFHIGEVLRKQNDLNAGIEEFSRAAEIIKPDIDSGSASLDELELYGDTIGARAEAAYRQGEKEKSLEDWNAWIELIDRQLEKDESSGRWLEHKTMALRSIGEVHTATNDTEKAKPAFEESISIGLGLIERDPTNDQWRHNLAITYLNQSRIFHFGGEFDEAMASYKRAAELIKPLLGRDSPDLSWYNDYAVALSGQANIESARNNYQQALEYYSESNQMIAELVELDPTNSIRMHNLASSYNSMANVHFNLFNDDKVIEYRKKALEILNKMVAEDPTHKQRLGDLVYTTLRLGQVYTETGEHQLALDVLRDVKDEAARLASSDNADTFWILDHAEVYLREGDVLSELHKFEEAEQAFLKSIEITSAALETAPDFTYLKGQLVNEYEALARLYQRGYQFDKALEVAENSNKYIKKLIDGEQRIQNREEIYAETFELIGQFQRGLGNDVESSENLVRAAEILSALAQDTDSPWNFLRNASFRTLDAAEAILWEDPARAEQLILNARDIADQIADKTEDGLMRRTYARLRSVIGARFLDLNKLDEAEASLAIAEEFNAMDMAAETLHPHVAETHIQIMDSRADLARQRGNVQEALRLRLALDEAAAKLLEANPDFEELLYYRTDSLLRLSYLYMMTSELERAQAMAQRAAELIQASDPERHEEKRSLAGAMVDQATYAHLLGNGEEALHWLETAMTTLASLREAHEQDRSAAMRYGRALLLKNEMAANPNAAELQTAADLIVDPALDTHEPIFYEAAARALLRSGRADEAAPILEHLERVNFSTPLLKRAQSGT